MSKANILEILLRNAEDELPNSFEMVIYFLKHIPLMDLVYLLDTNSHLYLRLLDNKYTTFWKGELKSINIDDKDFSFKIPKFTSPLQYLMGWLMFISNTHKDPALHNPDPKVHFDPKKSQIPKNTQLDTYFKIAQKYHSFHALGAALSLVIKQLYSDSGELTSENINNYRLIFEHQALFHGTPGYMLLANFMFHIGIMAREKCFQISKTNPNECFVYTQLANQFLSLTIQWIEVASLLKDDSEPEIHNAYFGSSLSMSNPFSIPDISTLPSTITVRFDLRYSPAEKQTMQDKARSLVDTFLKVAERRNKISTRIKVKDDEPPLLTAARHGKLEQVIAYKTTDKASLHVTDRNGNTALHLAPFGAELGIINYLIGLDPSLLDVKNNFGETLKQILDEVLELMSQLQVKASPEAEKRSADDRSLEVYSERFFKRFTGTSVSSSSQNFPVSDYKRTTSLQARQGVFGTAAAASLKPISQTKTSQSPEEKATDAPPSPSS